MSEAKVIFQELSEKFSSTVGVSACWASQQTQVFAERALCVQARLLNGMAVCHMRMGAWSDAESYLLEAYEKDAKNADTLANLVTVCLHLGKNAARHSKCARPCSVCTSYSTITATQP